MATLNQPVPAGADHDLDSGLPLQLRSCLGALSRGAWAAMKRDLGIAQVTRAAYLQHLTSSASIASSAELINQWIASSSEPTFNCHDGSGKAYTYTAKDTEAAALVTLLHTDRVAFSVFELLSAQHARSLRAASRACKEVVAAHPWHDEVTAIRNVARVLSQCSCSSLAELCRF
jgi:hypothetical protein